MPKEINGVNPLILSAFIALCIKFLDLLGIYLLFYIVVRCIHQTTLHNIAFIFNNNYHTALRVQSIGSRPTFRLYSLV